MPERTKRIVALFVSLCVVGGGLVEAAGNAARAPEQIARAVPTPEPRLGAAVPSAAKAVQTARPAIPNVRALPLSFEPNVGQAPGNVKFLAHLSAYRVALTGTEAVLDFRRIAFNEKKYRLEPKHTRVAARLAADAPNRIVGGVVRMQFRGAEAGAQTAAEERLPGVVNYYRGNDPTKWRTNVPTYAQVRYKDVYPGIDVVYYGNKGSLEYDLVMAPGADPRVVTIAMHGADRLQIDAAGELLIHAAGQTIRQTRPVAYQVVNGARQAVAVKHVLNADGTVGFETGTYRTDLALVIDPIDLGGGVVGVSNVVATDSDGNNYIVGEYLPACPVIDTCTDFVDSDVFVQKTDATGTTIFWTTKFGGTRDATLEDCPTPASCVQVLNGSDFVNGIVVDASGTAYVTGATNSKDFPACSASRCTTAIGTSGTPTEISVENAQTPAPGQTLLGGGNPAICAALNDKALCTDVFVAKLLTSGAISYATYLGGPDADFGQALTVDSSGVAHITGGTASSSIANVTVTGSYADGANGFPNEGDAFAAKISATGVIQSFAYFGGNYTETGSGISVDGSGTVSLAIETFVPSPLIVDARLREGIPVIATAETTYDPAIASPEMSLRPAPSSAATFMLLDVPAPTVGATANALQTFFGGGNSDTMIVKLSPAAAVTYASFLGGTGHDVPTGLKVDASNNMYIAGLTSSEDFLVANAVQSVHGGGTCIGEQGPRRCVDTFVTKLGPPTTTTTPLVYSTYLGGDGDDSPTGIAVTSNGGVMVSVLAASIVSSTLPPSPTETIVVTDENGDPILGENGQPVTKTFAIPQLVIAQLAGTTVTDAPPPISTVTLELPVGADVSQLGIATDPSGNVVIAGASGAGGLAVKLTNAFVTIDIRPGSKNNRVNLKSKGSIQVAILSTDTLSAPDFIDPGSLTFGHAGTELSLVKCAKHGRDVNRDGLKDLVCRFRTQKAAFVIGDFYGKLSGLLKDGSPIVGADSIRLVPNKKDGKGDDDNNFNDEDDND